ncbi:hypothetical protein IFM89_030170 [Coptis chinensis]|uniref:DYW domain-containing protein n=1 Tax=Coptis chinensis TaxID=261450 RepID=A0A835LD09_9MAGN|nr:hypothetical protein IFM89_030170 [Coptis chinensis]
MEPPTLSLSSSGVPAANQSFARRYKYVWPLILTVNLGIGGLPFESYSYGQGPIVNWLRLGCLETLRSCTLNMDIYSEEDWKCLCFVFTAFVGMCIPFFGGLLGLFGGLVFAPISYFYLKHQHHQCPTPITTLPPLSLLHPHTCTESRHIFDAPANLPARLSTREFRNWYGGIHGSRRDRQFVYSRFRPWHTCRDDALLTCLTFLGDFSQIAIGNHSGDLKIFDSNSGGSTHSFEGCKSARFSNSAEAFAALSTEPSRREVLLGSGLVRKFDLFSDYGGGGFHPSGNETVITFNAHGDVIYAILRQNLEDVTSAVHSCLVRHPLFSAFRTVDVVNYSDIATVPVDRCVLDFATEPTDSFVGLVTMDDHEEIEKGLRKNPGCSLMEAEEELLQTSFGLLTTTAGTLIRIVKNLRVCEDFHTVMCGVSLIMRREIVEG